MERDESMVGKGVALVPGFEPDISIKKGTAGEIEFGEGQLVKGVVLYVDASMEFVHLYHSHIGSSPVIRVQFVIINISRNHLLILQLL